MGVCIQYNTIGLYWVHTRFLWCLNKFLSYLRKLLPPMTHRVAENPGSLSKTQKPSGFLGWVLGFLYVWIKCLFELLFSNPISMMLRQISYCSWAQAPFLNRPSKNMKISNQPLAPWPSALFCMHSALDTLIGAQKALIRYKNLQFFFNYIYMDLNNLEISKTQKPNPKTQLGFWVVPTLMTHHSFRATSRPWSAHAWSQQ